MANIVPIQPIRVLFFMQQHLLEDAGDGRFATGREAGHPDGDALLVEKLLALASGNCALVPRDVGCFYCG